MAVTFDHGEAEAVARVLAAVAAADGAIKAREESFLDGFAVAHGVGAHHWIAVPLDEAALVRAVVDPEKRREVVRLCLQMALSDLDYAPAEIALIARVARALAVSDGELAALTEAARRK
ncbi:MAG TPA: TerB family tellurite resistance protein [Polyangia bacterium]|nr:TerB family tellurite resistance protein [Polyangia bacterium]